MSRPAETGARRGAAGGRRAADRLPQAHRARPRRRRPADLRRVRDPVRAGPRSRAGCSRATCCWRGSGATRRTAIPRTIDVHIRHLREKVERDPKDPEYLFTVRGVGYRFRDTEPDCTGARLRRPVTLSLRNRLALVFFTITLLAIGALYLYVAPGLQSRLMGEKLTELAHSARVHSGPVRRTVGSSTAAAGGAPDRRPHRERLGRPRDAAVGQRGAGATCSSRCRPTPSNAGRPAARCAAIRRPRDARRDPAGRDRDRVDAGGADGRGRLSGALRPARGRGDRLLGAGLRRAAHGQHGAPRDPRRRRDRAAGGAGRRLPGRPRAGAAGQAAGAGRQAGRRRRVHHADPGRLRRRARAAGGRVQRHAAATAATRAGAQEVHRHRLARAAHAGVLARRLPRAARGRGAGRRDAPAVPGPGARPGRAPGQALGRPARSVAGWSPARWSCVPRRSTSAS